MACVYEAVHRNGGSFAIKILKPERAANPDVRARFLREGYVSNTIGHPRVVRILDDDVAENGAPFLVMELLRGESLAVLADRSRGILPEAFVLKAARELLELLAFAHAKGIVHRDLKPDNLFWTEEAGLKVLDFGIARLRTPTFATTRLGIVLGTPCFMAPEQAAGAVSEVDGRTDVWGVAATLFLLLSGVPARDPKTSVVRKLRDVAPWVSKATCAIVDKGLATRKTDRWPSAEAMKRAIERAENTLAALASTIVLPLEPRPVWLRYAGSAALALFAVALALRSPSPSPPRASHAVTIPEPPPTIAVSVAAATAPPPIEPRPAPRAARARPAGRIPTTRE